MCKPYLQLLYGTYFQERIQSYLFMISQRKVSVQFAHFYERELLHGTSRHTIIFIQSPFWEGKWDPLPLRFTTKISTRAIFVWWDAYDFLHRIFSDCPRNCNKKKQDAVPPVQVDRFRCGTSLFSAGPLGNLATEPTFIQIQSYLSSW